MFLTEIAMRRSAVMALRGRTWAGQMVRDSEIGVIDDQAVGQTVPFIAVYTDDGNQKGSHRDLKSSMGTTRLTFEIGVNSRMEIEQAPGVAPELQWVIAETDAAVEFTVGIVAHQITAALSDPSNAWAEIWRSFVMETASAKWERGASSRDGLRFAARQYMIDVELLRDPHHGRPLGPVWTAFLAAAEAEPDMAAMAAVLRDAATGKPMSNLDTVRAAYGLTGPEANALLLGP